MVGGLKRATSYLAIAAASGFVIGSASLAPAKAADLGGDCCADLEERVAELEATTVRKGNRKVSVTLYGWVNAGVIWYDNGEESDLYVIDVDAAVSRLGVKGSGKIHPGLEAGYRLELATPGPAEMGFVGEDDADDGTGGVRIRQANVWIQSDTLGRLTVGQGDTGSDGILDGVDLSGAGGWISYNGHGDWVFSYNVMNNAGTGTGNLWGFMSAFDSGRENVVRYDTPTWEGFSVSASWSEDDQADVALRYSKDWSGVTVAAAVGYFYSNDEGGLNDVAIALDSDNGGVQDTALIGSEYEVWGGSLSVYHAASGLFAVGSYGHMEATGDFIQAGPDAADGFAGSATTADADQWYAKLGIRGNWSGMGETSVYGEYGETQGDFAAGAGVSPFGGVGNFALGGTLGANVTSVEGTMWGVGLGQDLDAIGATMYIGYRHLEAEIDQSANASTGLPNNGAALASGRLATEDIDAVLAGMVVPF